VIAYVTRKYGADHVAQIITFGTMLARAAIRDVGRVLGLGYGEVDRIAKAVPNQLGIKLEEALQTAPALREMQEADTQVRKLLELAQQVEGVARNASTHAAGVVISEDPLTDLMPLQRATNSDALMTQYEMHSVEALGLLKFDFLGLSNLTILRQAVDLIAETRGVAIDLDHLPLEDAKTFELLASGETTGVFQLESPGMRRYIKELRPTSVYDLAAMVALFRPGPMDNIPAYIRRKHGHEQVSYLHPLLEPYLEKTYGIFVYQEDIMAAAIALGGFTGPEADTLGYAIRKKKSSVLRSMKDKFVSQAAERGVRADIIDKVFESFQPFERYGFNKAHATCYGLIAYQTAYLKANYTVEYMASVLTAFRSDTDKVAAAIAECRRLGIEVRPPDVHGSSLDFTVEGDAIRFGLLAVKNVGHGAIESIVACRDAEGPFRSLADFCSRVDMRLCNKRVLESLIKVGALNALGHPAQLLLGLDDAVGVGQSAQRDRISGQVSLFDMGADSAPMERPLPPATEAPPRERLRWEKELMGLYLSAHPMGELASMVGDYVTAYASDLGEELDQQRVVLGGVITAVRRVVTKSKSTMAVATLEDLQGTLEVVVFPKVLEQTATSWTEDAIVLVAGRVDHKGDETVLLADAVWSWDQVAALGPDRFRETVAATDRGRRGGNARGRWDNGRPAEAPNGNGWSGTGHGAVAPAVANGHPPAHPNGNGVAATMPGPAPLREPVSVVTPAPTAPYVSKVVPRVSPLRGGTVEGTIEVVISGTPPGTSPAPIRVPPPVRVPPPAPVQVPPTAAPPAPVDALVPRPSEPRAEAAEPAAVTALDADHDDPALPDEARRRVVTDEQAPTEPLQASAGQSLSVTFRNAPQETLIGAFKALNELIRAHPGETPVVLHIPAAGGRAQPMELPLRVAYDAELVSSVRRRFGDGLVSLELR
jgi:DNA polymerase-3 subunit alpha